MDKFRDLPRFREMNPIPIALIGIGLTVLMVLVALNFDKLPFVNSSKTYQAEVMDAAGLKSGDDVRVAGLKVGAVGGIELEDEHVLVTFTVDKKIRLGDKTGADIKTESLLGTRGLRVRPAGAGDIGKNGRIPLAHTTTPYALTDALGELTTTVEEIDTDVVTDALNSFSENLQDTPEELRDALNGITGLSKSISERDESLRQLMARANGVTGVLSDRSEQLNALVLDANALLSQLDERKQMLSQLIVNIGAVSTQLTGFVQDNEAEMQPTLDKLSQVLEVMIANRDNISESLDGVSKYMYALGESVSSGPYFQAYIQNFINLGPGFNTTDLLTPLFNHLAQNTAAAAIPAPADSAAADPGPGAQSPLDLVPGAADALSGITDGGGR